MFTSRAEGFINASSAAPINPIVPGLSTTWIETTSAVRNSSSFVTRRTPVAAAALDVKFRLQAMTLMPNASPTFATPDPTRPKPMMPVEEILSECASLDGTSQITVCRRYHSHIYLERFRAPDAFELPLLKHSQQCDLCLHWKLADLIDKDRAAVGCFKAAGAPLQIASERAFLVSEQLRRD